MGDVSLKGEKLDYERAHFPWLGGTPSANIHQEMHFVLPRDFLNHKARTLEDYDKKSTLALAHILSLTMIAEAVTNVTRYRGAEYGKFYLNDNPRIAIILTYVPHRLFENEEEHTGLFSQRTMLEDDNIVALMFSILVMDPDLDLADALSDQFMHSKYGPPRHGEVRAPRAPQQRRRRNHDDDDEDDSDNEEDEVPQAPPPLFDGRPDKPGERLEAGAWYFRKTPEGGSVLRPNVLLSTSPDNLFRRIQDLRAYITIVCQATAGIDQAFNCAWSDSKRVADIAPDSSMYPTNAFSLDRAIEKLTVLEAHAFFLDKENWQANYRPGHGEMGLVPAFGAPSWTAGPGRPEAGTAPTCAFFQPAMFNARALMSKCLPHCRLSDDVMLQPNMRLQRTMVGRGNNDAFCLEDMLESFGVLTSSLEHKRERAKSLNLDIFNTYFEVYAELDARIRALAVDPNMPSSDYVQRLAQLREQGFSNFFSAMDTGNTELPRGYRDMIFSVWERDEWHPTYDRMWQPTAEHMSPFAQYRVHEHILVEVLNEIADSTIFLYHRAMRCVYSIYLPRVGTRLNKEHIQIVAGAGASKSDLLNKIVQLMLKGTYEIQGGASAMGLLGENKSERLLEIFHELTETLAPEVDPSGENMKIHLMLLTKLAEGKVAYKTSNELIDARGIKSRSLFKSEADYTNVILAARNMKKLKLTSGGTGEAMYDRFNVHHFRPIVDRKRVALINKVLDTGPAVKSRTFLKYQAQLHLFQRAVMEYGALICYYAVPLPDLRLFSDLAPLGVAYLANLRPELFFKLRDIGRLSTRMMVETIHYAVRLALASPLNPTTVVQEVDGITTPVFAEYETERIAIEVSKYAYANMDVLVYVLTEAMYEFTAAENFSIMREFAQRFANYIPMGFGPERSARHVAPAWNPEEKTRHVPLPPAPAAPPAAAYDPMQQLIGSLENNYMEQIAEHAPAQGPLKSFIETYLRGAVYHLGVENRKEARPVPGENPNAAAYHPRELTEVPIDEAYEELYLLNAPAEAPRKLDRQKVPSYKIEYIGNDKFVNPNYVKIQGNYAEFAKSISGSVGTYNMSTADITNLLWGLNSKDMITPYMPIVPWKSALRHKLVDVQSMRYVREAWRQFPKYKVPILMLDSHKHCFYVLVSYLESDLYKVAEGLIEHICYHATYRRSSIMGIPSQVSPVHFQPVEIAPIEGRTLHIARKQNSTPGVIALLEGYAVEEEQVLQQQDMYFTEEDIEEKYALQYLKLNFPTSSHETLHSYTPRGIEARLYGYDGFYAQGTHRFVAGHYPECMLERPAATAQRPPPLQKQQQPPPQTIPPLVVPDLMMAGVPDAFFKRPGTGKHKEAKRAKPDPALVDAKMAPFLNQIS